MTRTTLDHDWFPEPLPANVEIGEGSWLYSSYAFRHYRSQAGVRIGRHTGVYIGSFFDLGPDGRVEIGDYSTLVGAIFATNGRIVVRDYAFIAHEVLLADRSVAVPGGSPTENLAAALPDPVITVGEDAWIAARVVLLAGAHIGKGSVIGAAAIVDFTVPDHTIVAGNPARIVGRTR